jgi:hypothetical protein
MVSATRASNAVRTKAIAASLAAAVLLSTPPAGRLFSVQAISQASISATGQKLGELGLRSMTTLPQLGGPGLPSGSDGVIKDGQKRINVGPLLNWIWSNARYLWNSIVNAVRSGWSSFVGWWNGLNGWMRGVFSWFGGGTLWDIYLSLRHYFFGW